MRTTKADYQSFLDSCNKYVDILGVKDWSIHYAHELVEGVYANTVTDVDGHVATIRFSKYWDDMRVKTPKEIDRLALHEILHIVFAPFLHEASARYTYPDIIRQYEHNIIRRLENLAQ